MTGALPVLLSVGALAAYLAGVARLRRVQQRRWPLRRTGAAVGAAAVVVVAVSPLLHAPSGAGHGDHAGSVPSTLTVLPDVLPVALPVVLTDPLPGGAVGHMVQHLLLGMYAPVLVVLAAPVTLALAVVPLRWRHRCRRLLASRSAAVLTHPVVAAVPAVVGMHVLFLTPLYQLSLAHAWVHHAVQLHLLLSGSLLAWALVGGDPVPPRSGLLLRLAVLVVSAGTHAWLATLVYARAPDLPPGSPYGAEETRQAALWMYYGGDVAEVLLAVLVCLAWYRRRGAALRRPGTRARVGSPA